MNIILIILLGVIFKIGQTLDLEAENFCVRPQTQCKKDACEMKICTGQFKLRCNFDTCSSTLESCDLLRKFEKKEKFTN